MLHDAIASAISLRWQRGVRVEVSCALCSWLMVAVASRQVAFMSRAKQQACNALQKVGSTEQACNALQKVRSTKRRS